MQPSYSALCSKFENNLIDGLLQGDGGYSCRHYLMTPVNNPVTDKERNYNKAHIATRGKVERMFSVWKQRFHCLRIPLRMHLENSLTVIVSTACLHNFAINDGDFIEEEPEVVVESIIMNSSSGTLSGNSARQRIIDFFFNFGNCILTTFFHTGKAGSINHQVLILIIRRSQNN